MCGIFGHLPYKGRDVNVDRCKILGLVNESRGRDSCGYYYNGNLYKGVDKEKLWENMLQQHCVIPGNAAPAFLGHTRASTVGSSTAANAHPFYIDGTIFTHNGTLYNCEELAEKYKVDIKGLNVDSHQLGKIIHETGFGVLNDYIGFAALSFIKDGTQHLYHGMSKTYSTQKECQEERPLWFMYSDDGLYYSSMPEALQMICGPEDEIHNLAYNRVWRWDGKQLRRAYVVNREETNVDVWKHKNAASTTGYFAGNNTFIPAAPRTGTAGVTTNSTAPSSIIVLDSMVWRETLPKRAEKCGFVFAWRGRHWMRREQRSTNNLVTDPDYELMQGTYRLDGKGMASEHGPEYTFHRGVMIGDGKVDSWKKFLEIPESRMIRAREGAIFGNFARTMSAFSKYPVTNLHTEGAELDSTERFTWWWHGANKISTKFCPKFSSRNYAIESGELLKITPSDCKDVQTLEPKSGSSVFVINDAGVYVPMVGPAPFATPFNMNNAPDDITNETFHEEKQKVRTFFNKVFTSSFEFWAEHDNNCEEIMCNFISNEIEAEHEISPSNTEIMDELCNQIVEAGVTLIEQLGSTFNLEDEMEDWFVMMEEDDDEEGMEGEYVMTDEDKEARAKLGLPETPRESKALVAIAAMAQAMEDEGGPFLLHPEQADAENEANFERHLKSEVFNKGTIDQVEIGIDRGLQRLEEKQEKQEYLDTKVLELEDLFDNIHRVAQSFHADNLKEEDDNVNEGIASILFQGAEDFKERLTTAAKRYDLTINFKS